MSSFVVTVRVRLFTQHHTVHNNQEPYKIFYEAKNSLQLTSIVTRDSSFALILQVCGGCLHVMQYSAQFYVLNFSYIYIPVACHYLERTLWITRVLCSYRTCINVYSFFYTNQLGDVLLWLRKIIPGTPRFLFLASAHQHTTRTTAFPFQHDNIPTLEFFFWIRTLGSSKTLHLGKLDKFNYWEAYLDDLAKGANLSGPSCCLLSNLVSTVTSGPKKLVRRRVTCRTTCQACVREFWNDGEQTERAGMLTHWHLYWD
jgi:hypothetical protein